MAGRAGTARKLAANGYRVEARRERMVAQLEVEVVEGMAAARGSGSRRAESASGRRGVARRGVEPRAAAGTVRREQLVEPPALLVKQRETARRASSP